MGDTLCKPNTNNTKQAKDKGPRRKGGLATAGDGQYSRRDEEGRLQLERIGETVTERDGDVLKDPYPHSAKGLM